ncbi:MAG: hypothetical protein Q9191_003304 [Dirinaria sp. TL-2023a]
MSSSEGMSDEREASDAGENGNSAKKPGPVDGADDADLFGSGSDDEEQASPGASKKRRTIDDAELNSSDDEDMIDRAEDEYGDHKEPPPDREETVLDVSMSRHAIPKPSDGELYLLQLPSFLAIEPKAFSPNNWKPPTTEHHSSSDPSSTFSAYNTSNNTIRWRRSPNDPEEIQSNARILRWSDGSLTVQLASNAKEQFLLSAKALAPPQINPVKPTPTSIQRATNGINSYNDRLDSHTYLGAPYMSISVTRLTNHITASLAVQSHSEQDDEALIRLQETLAAARGANKGKDGGIELMHVTQDPEQGKKDAEKFARDQVKAARRRQNQEERERERSNRAVGRSGLRTGYGAGLTVGGLEDDDDGMATTRARPSKPKSKKPRRRNSEYSDEEDFPIRGRTREDEYDEDDGFLVGSDEEPEIVEDASEEEEEDIAMDEEKASKGNTKRQAAEPDPGTAGGRSKRRRVIDEDEDEE